MKKIFILLILALFALTACGNGQPEPDPDPEPGQTGNEPAANAPSPGDTAPADPNLPPTDGDEPPEIPEFALKVGDFLIEMDQNITYVLSALGEPQGIFVAPSCAFDGEDRIFQYSNIQIHTYPKGDDDHVHTISLRDDSVRTTEGKIYLGSSLQEMLDAYGDDYEYDNDMYKYTRGLTTLEFFIEEDIVIGITYGFIIQQ